MNTDDSALTVGEIGELGLLERIHRFCPMEIVGDDAALVSIPAEQLLVVTNDVLVDGVHFSDKTTTAEDVGWRAAAASLSDLAAMGAQPRGITVGLGISSDLPVAWIESLYEGLRQCLDRYNSLLLGGDVCRSRVITVSITAL
ncbi:MAG: thiamine-phosphate kinase, partial [Cyanothece sp. SIO1E1]|nr:thiamine-phosphate kinase [Cyanothece sp. SIO1E1]